MRDVVIVDSIRTGLAKSFRGTFNLTRPDDMVAHLIDGLLERSPALDPAEVEDCIVGCADQTGEQTGNIGRLAVALSRLPVSVPGSSVNRFCSSGLNTVATAATQVASGFADVIMAGGVESITSFQRANCGEISKNPRLLESKPDIYMAMGNTAEVVARRYTSSAASTRTSTRSRASSAPPSRRPRAGSRTRFTRCRCAGRRPIARPASPRNSMESSTATNATARAPPRKGSRDFRPRSRRMGR